MTVSTKQLVPFHKGRPIFGSYFELLQQPNRFYSEVAWAHGGMARFRIFQKTLYSVAHPEYIYHILVGNQNNYPKGDIYINAEMVLGKGMITVRDLEKWKVKRNAVAPLFHKKAISRLIPVINNAVNERVAHMQDKGNGTEVTHEMKLITQRVISEVVFGKAIDPSISEAFSGIISMSGQLITRKNWSLINFPPNWPTPLNRKINRFRKTLTDMLVNMIQERQREGIGKNGDVLDLLFMTYGEDPEGILAISDDVLTLYAAGYDTTSSTLSWALYHLAQHPEYQVQLQKEADEVLGGKEPDWEDIERLKFAGQCFSESMRLHTAVHTISRTCQADDTIGGYFIPAGAVMMVSLHGLHRSPDDWPNAETFYPERFAEDAIPPVNKRAFAPFSSGKRSCIGAQLANVEGKLMLANIAHRFNIRMVPGHDPVTSKGALNFPVNLRLSFSPR